MNVTVDGVMALKPCYSREHVTRLFAGRPHVSAADIASAAISYDNRIWLLLRLAPREVWLPAVYRAAERAIRHACWALHNAGLHDDAEELACAAPTIVSGAAAEAAGAAAWAARGAAEAAELQLFVTDLAACLDAPAAGGGR